MLVYAAIGDAYGAAFEFLNYERWPLNNGQAYFRQPDTGLGDGKYTDDTQMMAALMTTMNEHYTTLVSSSEIVENFFQSYKADPRPGYSMGFKNLMDECETATELYDRLNPQSTRSGAVMRAAPVGAYKAIEAVLEMSARQAAITHNTPIAIECAQAVALLAHYLIHVGGPRDKAREFINANVPNRTVDWTIDRTDWASVEAVDCARNAITAWYNSHSVTDVLVRSVAPGGDTDTVATIAMSLAWADKSLDDDLHVNMMSDLESGTFGFGYLFDINHRFVEKFCK